MKTTKELLAESRELRFEFKKPEVIAEIGPQVFQKPLPWNYYFGQVLGAVGSDVWWHVYLPRMEYGIGDYPDSVTVIIHGHSRREHCATKTLCHVLGYKPDGVLPIDLQKQWEKFGYELEISSDL